MEGKSRGSSRPSPPPLRYGSGSKGVEKFIGCLHTRDSKSFFITPVKFRATMVNRGSKRILRFFISSSLFFFFFLRIPRRSFPCNPVLKTRRIEEDVNKSCNKSRLKSRGSICLSPPFFKAQRGSIHVYEASNFYARLFNGSIIINCV